MLRKLEKKVLGSAKFCLLSTMKVNLTRLPETRFKVRVLQAISMQHHIYCLVIESASVSAVSSSRTLKYHACKSGCDRFSVRSVSLSFEQPVIFLHWGLHNMDVSLLRDSATFVLFQRGANNRVITLNKYTCFFYLNLFSFASRSTQFKHELLVFLWSYRRCGVAVSMRGEDPAWLIFTVYKE